MIRAMSGEKLSSETTEKFSIIVYYYVRNNLYKPRARVRNNTNITSDTL